MQINLLSPPTQRLLTKSILASVFTLALSPTPTPFAFSQTPVETTKTSEPPTGQQGETLSQLLRSLTSDDSTLRDIAAETVKTMKPPALDVVLTQLIKDLESTDPAVRKKAADAIGSVGPVALDQAFDALSAAVDRETDHDALVAEVLALQRINPVIPTYSPRSINIIGFGGSHDSSSYETYIFMRFVMPSVLGYSWFIPEAGTYDANETGHIRHIDDEYLSQLTALMKMNDDFHMRDKRPARGEILRSKIQLLLYFAGQPRSPVSEEFRRLETFVKDKEKGIYEAIKDDVASTGEEIWPRLIGTRWSGDLEALGDKVPRSLPDEKDNEAWHALIKTLMIRMAERPEAEALGVPIEQLTIYAQDARDPAVWPKVFDEVVIKMVNRAWIANLRKVAESIEKIEGVSGGVLPINFVVGEFHVNGDFRRELGKEYRGRKVNIFRSHESVPQEFLPEYRIIHALLKEGDERRKQAIASLKSIDLDRFPDHRFFLNMLNNLIWQLNKKLRDTSEPEDERSRKINILTDIFEKVRPSDGYPERFLQELSRSEAIDTLKGISRQHGDSATRGLAQRALDQVLSGRENK